MHPGRDTTSIVLVGIPDPDSGTGHVVTIPFPGRDVQNGAGCRFEVPCRLQERHHDEDEDEYSQDEEDGG